MFLVFTVTWQIFQIFLRTFSITSGYSVFAHLMKLLVLLSLAGVCTSNPPNKQIIAYQVIFWWIFLPSINIAGMMHPHSPYFLVTYRASFCIERKHFWSTS